jgi:tetratricopeptide (TPR) repeat protein
LANLSLISSARRLAPGSRIGNHSLIYTTKLAMSGDSQYARELGDIALQQGNLEQAEERFHQGLVLRQQLGQHWREAESLFRLGEIAHQRRQYLEAKGYAQECLAIFRDLGDLARLSRALSFYAEVCTALGELRSAKESLTRAIQVAGEIGSESLRLSALLGLATLLIIENNSDRSVEILAYLLNNPSLPYAERQKSEQLMADLQAILPPHIFQSAFIKGIRQKPSDSVAAFQE